MCSFLVSKYKISLSPIYTCFVVFIDESRFLFEKLYKHSSNDPDVNKNRFAELISIVFQPEISILFLPALIAIKTGQLYITELVICAILLCVTQVLVIKYFMKSEERYNRRILYVAAILSFSICSVLMVLIDHNGYYLFISVSFLIISILLAVINVKTKVSIHCSVISLVAMTIALFFWPVGIVFLFLIPLVSWSRLYLKEHTLDQVLLGCFVGIMVSTLVYMLMDTYMNQFF